jgi:hypothetical protein
LSKPSSVASSPTANSVLDVKEHSLIWNGFAAVRRASAFGAGLPTEFGAGLLTPAIRGTMFGAGLPTPPSAGLRTHSPT